MYFQHHQSVCFLTALAICVRTEQDTLVGRVPLAEIKNGKVSFKQKPMSLDKQSETLQGTFSFCVRRKSLICVSPRNRQISRDARVLESAFGPNSERTSSTDRKTMSRKVAHLFGYGVGYLLNDRSDKGMGPLAKAIKIELAVDTAPSTDPSGSLTTSDKLPTLILESAILSVAERTNYGVEDEKLKTPAALCVWRWEVKDRAMLPAAVVETADLRRKERIGFKKEIQTVFESMDPSERSALFAKGTLKKENGKSKENQSVPNAETIVPNGSQEVRSNEIVGHTPVLTTTLALCRKILAAQATRPRKIG